VNLPELIRRYQHRLDDLLPGEAVPAHEAYQRFLRELGELKRADTAPLYLNTADAATQLGVKPKTIIHYCEQGILPGARKTGRNGGGRWIIPVDALGQFLNSRPV
jgi:hypothetical protein